MILALRSSTDFSIEDGDGKKYSIEEARKLFEDNKLDDWNLAFSRLVTNNFNLEKTKGFYIK